jgi:hypothetical protein
MPQGGEKPEPASSLTNFKSIGYRDAGRVPVRQGHHFGVSLNPRPLRTIGALTQASYPKLGVAIEGLHYAKTGVTEQELDGWSTTQMIE